MASAKGGSGQGGSEKPAAGGSSRKIVQLRKFKKQYRGHSGTWDKDFVADFLFSLGSPNGASPPVTFWCEVRLRDNLRNRGRWKELSEADTFKALYLFAVETIQKAGGRPVRQMELGWTPNAPYGEGPHWDLSAVNLKKPAPMAIEGDGVQPVVVHQH